MRLTPMLPLALPLTFLVAFGATPVHAGVCGAAKLAATGKHAAAALGCHAKAVGKGNPLNAGCLAKAASSFDAAFAKAETKADCAATGDAAQVAARIAGAVDDVVSALGGPGPSACTATKLLAAGKRAAARHTCVAKGQKKSRGVDPSCVGKANAKFVQAFRKAEAKGDCLAPGGDDPAIAAIVDALLAEGRQTIAPSVSTCAPLAVTTVHGDDVHPNSRLARIVKGKVPCVHGEDLTTTKCRFSTAAGTESGTWLESPEGPFAKVGQSITKDGIPGGEYVVAADASIGPVRCAESTGMDTQGLIPSGQELSASCIIEDVLASYNAYFDPDFGFGFSRLINYVDGIVCSTDAEHPDGATYEGHGGLGDDVFCWSGHGAALNDPNGVERDDYYFYFTRLDRCHYLHVGGFEVPGAKRPGSFSSPAPGRVNPRTPILWRPVLRIDIANKRTPNPSLPTPTRTATPSDDQPTATPDAEDTATPTPTATETPSPSPTVTPEPDYLVDTTADDPALTDCDLATPADCSLRGALANAYGTLTPKTIAIPAGTYVLTATATCVHKTTQFGQNNVYDTTSLCVSGAITLVGDGPASTIIDGNGTARVLLVGNPAPVHVAGVTLTNGHFAGGSLYGAGGAINNGGDLTLTDCVVADSDTANGTGGGIYSAGPLTIERCVFSGNSAPTGGGIAQESFNAPVDATIVDSAFVGNHATGDHGGGLFLYSGNAGGTTTIRGSTFAANDALLTGGGIAIAGLDGTLTLTNSTISGNRCFWYYGGGLHDLGRSTIAFRNVTVTGNRSEDAGGTNGAGGGISLDPTTTATLANTIIAGNTAPGFAPDCYDGGGAAALTSLGYNLIGTPGDAGNGTTYCDLTAAAGDTVGEDPLLGVLADNGGSTQTHVPAAGSPAIDTGDPNGCLDPDQSVLATDQRGVSRPLDGDGDTDARCDRGAVEVAQ